MTKILSLQNHSVDQELKASKIYKHYESTLDSFWSGNAKKTVEESSQAALDYVDNPHKFLFYRLWIEQLSNLKEYASLRLLYKHLQKLSDDDVSSSIALRGIIHLELDEWEACNLYLRSVSQIKSNTYCLEFKQRCALRGMKQRIDLPLLYSKDPIMDFFHWQTLAKCLLVNGDFPILQHVLNHTEKLLPSSPMKDMFAVYQAIEEESFGPATKICGNIIKRFPDNVDYNLLYGYLLLSCEQVDGAKKVLEHADTLTAGRDGDVLGLLAYSHHLLSEGQTTSSHWQLSIDMFTKAKTLLRNQGITPLEIILNLALFKETVKENPSTYKQGNLWFVNLASSRYAELCDMKAEDCQYMFYPVSSKLKKNDWVFFTGTSIDGDIRIKAIYQALTPAIWHPIDKWQSALGIMSFFDHPLRFSKEAHYFGKSTSKKSWTNPGVSLLNSEGIEALNSVLSDFGLTFEFETNRIRQEAAV